MKAGLLEEVRETALRMGAGVPRWLQEGRVPEFCTKEAGSEGPTLILLHGLFGAVSNWDSTFELMSRFSRTIALSLPIITGHRSEVKVKALAAYTELFIRSRDLGPAVLCGNSLGGHVALRVALASPELVDCLILSGASGLYEHSVDALPVRPGRQYLREHMQRVFFNERFVTEDRIDEILEILSSRSNHLNLIHAARSAKKDNLLLSLRDVVAPTLLLWGQNDEVTTMAVAKQFHDNIPNSELVTINNCGHAPMIEYPEWFTDQVVEFLREHSQYYQHA